MNATRFVIIERWLDMHNLVNINYRKEVALIILP